MRRLSRVYLLVEGQDLSRFLATDRGAITYPSYTCRHGSTGRTAGRHRLTPSNTYRP